jgi:hypothetical protein
MRRCISFSGNTGLYSLKVDTEAGASKGNLAIPHKAC